MVLKKFQIELNKYQQTINRKTITADFQFELTVTYINIDVH